MRQGVGRGGSGHVHTAQFAIGQDLQLKLGDGGGGDGGWGGGGGAGGWWMEAGGDSDHFRQPNSMFGIREKCTAHKMPQKLKTDLIKEVEDNPSKLRKTTAEESGIPCSTQSTILKEREKYKQKQVGGEENEKD